MNERQVALVDMDCFYCQVETRLNPSLKGKPMAVVQYNQWKGGGIIAVNYEARDRGVTRHMRGEEAKKHCPEIELVSVPSVRGKADLTKYRDAGREVIKVLCQFSETVQRASVDEAYIDLTDAVRKRLALKMKVSPTQLENTFIVGYSADDSNEEVERERGVATWLQEVYDSELADPELHRLATATALVEEMRAAVYEKTGFRCSAGISHNKILAKLVCGMHKPNRQTALPMSSVPGLFSSLPVKKVRNLGGKLGEDIVERLGITHMAELMNFTEKQLQAKYDEKTANWLYNIARGIDHDPVTPRLISKSIGCSKNFPGKNALRTRPNVTHWVSELAAEVAERLAEDLHMNKRKAQLLTVHFVQDIGGRDVSMSRSIALAGYDAEKIAASAFSVLSRLNSAPSASDNWEPALKYLGISTSKFVDCSRNSVGSIDKFFRDAPSTSESVLSKSSDSEEIASKPTRPENYSETDSKSYQTTNANPLPSHDGKPDTNCNRGSFFERYFKDQPNKIVRRCNPFKTLGNQFLERTNMSSNDSKQQQVLTENITSNVKHEDCESMEVERNTKKEATYEENPQEPDESFISPSEIFPDLENIDDSVLNILPSPLQRKIAILKEAKSKSTSECNEKTMKYSRESTDSECAPTRVETKVDVHTTPSGTNVASTSSKSVPQPKSTVEEDECEDDLIEPEGLFDQTSLDVFDLESHQRAEEEDENDQSKTCDKCKELILVSDFQEHLDHHVAKELHEQLNKPVQPCRTEVKASKIVTVQSDRKRRGRPSKKDPVPPKKSRTILSFFTKT